jgi:hypothetical protein
MSSGCDTALSDDAGAGLERPVTEHGIGPAPEHAGSARLPHAVARICAADAYNADAVGLALGVVVIGPARTEPEDAG